MRKGSKKMKKRSFCMILAGLVLCGSIFLFKGTAFGLYRFSMEFFRDLFSLEKAREVFCVEEEEYVEVFGESNEEVFV